MLTPNFDHSCFLKIDSKVTVKCFGEIVALYFSVNTKLPNVSKAYTRKLLQSKIVDKLYAISAAVVQAEFANELMDNHNLHCPLVPSLQTLGRNKSKANRKEFPCRNENPIESISMMKKEPEFADCIVRNCLNP